ncbi:MAG TPA: sigma-E factor negative regulatory protein [Burkholderiaceae bacterium]|nr:sigma-E factor negative regulatory protein [Burkholderiaceae bacterium]
MMNHPMSQEDRKQTLSALVDGEADSNDFERMCSAWREDVELRRTCHAYHLIGDVLRSADLAHPPSHDAVFLQSLRSRLANEPVVMAPGRSDPCSADVAVGAGAMLARPATGRRWGVPAAFAAGFIAMGGLLVAARVGVPFGKSDVPIGVTAAPAVAATSMPVEQPDAPILYPDQQLIRDARLDRYLAAHKQYGSTSVVSVPGGVLRSTAAVSLER